MIILFFTNYENRIWLQMCCLDANSQLFLLRTPSFNFLKTLSFQNRTFPDLQDLHREVEQHNFQHPTFTLINGIVYYKGKPFLGKVLHLKIYFTKVS